jgi:K+-sensing histidine kinase KdpD
MKGRIILALLLPCAALLLQWLLWRWISPFVWFIFFPAIFFSARIGGRWGGMLSTVLSIVLVWFFFITPQLSWHVSNLHNLLSVPLFLLMGYLLSDNQERLQRAQRKMAAALDETRAANQQTLQLYQKTLELDQLKTQFIANLSHELRTPLTLIMSPLAQRLATHDADTQRRREDEMMLRNARLLYRQVSDLLDAAKLEAGKMELDYARIDLSKLIGGTAAQFDSLARDKGIGWPAAGGSRGRKGPAHRAQPAVQRLQVHSHGRQDRLASEHSSAAGAAAGGRQWSRHTASHAPGCI